MNLQISICSCRGICSIGYFLNELRLELSRQLIASIDSLERLIGIGAAQSILASVAKVVSAQLRKCDVNR